MHSLAPEEVAALHALVPVLRSSSWMKTVLASLAGVCSFVLFAPLCVFVAMFCCRMPLFSRLCLFSRQLAPGVGCAACSILCSLPPAQFPVCAARQLHVAAQVAWLGGVAFVDG